MPVSWETFFGSYNLFMAEIFFSQLQHLRQRAKRVNEHPLSDPPFLFDPRSCNCFLFFFPILLTCPSLFLSAPPQGVYILQTYSISIKYLILC